MFSFPIFLLPSAFISAICRFDALNGMLTFEPSCFLTCIPSMNIFCLFKSISATFPLFFLNFPLMIFTLSPFLNRRFLFLYFFLSSFERFTFRNFLFMCRGAFALYFLCLRGCLLDFQCLLNLFFI